MWETCAVELRLRLPRELAAEVEEVHRRDPDALSRLLVYALTRRTIFEHLRDRWSARDPEPGPRAAR